MAQGKTKGLQSKAPSARKERKAAGNLKKGQKHIPPKKQSLIEKARRDNSLRAKLSRSIEAQMASAASSGKLTIMKNAVPQTASSTSNVRATAK